MLQHLRRHLLAKRLSFEQAWLQAKRGLEDAEAAGVFTCNFTATGPMPSWKKAAYARLLHKLGVMDKFTNRTAF